MGDKRENSEESTQNYKKLKNDDENLSSFEKLLQEVGGLIYEKLEVKDLKNLFLVSKKLVKIFEYIEKFYINIFF